MQIIRILLRPRRITLSKNARSKIPNIELDLDIIINNMCANFYFNIIILCRENEGQLLVDRPTNIQTERPTDRKHQSNMNIRGPHLYFQDVFG